MTTIWEQKHEIYEDALPFRAGRSDIFHIDLADRSATEAILDPLFRTGTFRLSIQENANRDLPLAYWFQEARVQECIYGHRPLGLGFPLLVFSDGDDLVAAPLFIWGLSLQPSPQTPGVWELKHEPEQGVQVNQRLLGRLREQLSPEQLASLQALPDGGFEALLARLRALAAHLGWKPPAADSVPRPCPPLRVLSEASDSGQVFLSGVIGIYPSPVPLVDLADKAALWEKEAGPAEGHAAGYGPLDPHQASVFHHMRSGHPVLVDGAAGTGKTRVGLHLLTNALSNGQTCLVLSPAAGALEKIRQGLARLGLESFCLLATDLLKDRSRLPGAIRSALAARSTAPHDAGRFQQVLSKWQREKQKLDARYEALRQPVFGGYDWADTVGLFLASNRRAGKELLSANLNRQDFQFTDQEFEMLKAAVQSSRPSYQQVNTLRHPLRNLHPDLFLRRDQAEAKAYLSEQLNVFLRKCTYLHKRYIAKADEYAGRLQAYYERWYNDLVHRADRLLEKTEDDAVQFGRDYELTSMISLRLYGALFGRFRRMRSAKQATFKDYRALVAQFHSAPQFNFDFAPATEGRMLPRMRESLSAFRNRLSTWHEQLPALVREELVRLSHKTVHPQLHFAGHIRELEEALELLLAELNQAGLYEEPFENRMLTLQKRRKYLEGIMEQLESTRLFLRDFDRFYAWQRHWLQLPAPGQKLVQALVKVKPADWMGAFESWYLHNCLVKAYSPALPSSNFSFRQYVYNHDQLQELLLPQVMHRWHEQRRNLLRELRKTNKDHYQLLSGKREDDSALLHLLTTDPSLVSQLFPIWLLTPQVAAQLALPTAAFDYSVVQQAHLLTVEQAYAGLAAGQRRIVLGDTQQALLGPKHSLMEEAKRHSVVFCRLSTIHDWNQGDVLRLLHPMRVLDEAIGPLDVSIENVGGRFDEQKQTNEAEARAVVRLLHTVEKLPEDRYPAVAVVAFTKEQRDLIASYLLEVQQRQMMGSAHLQALEAAGLRIFSLEDLPGCHPEVLIITATFGRSAREGPLTEHLQRLDRPTGKALLSILMSRPSRKLRLLHSFPEASLKKFSEDQEKGGTFLLVNYFNYIYALQHADAEGQQQVIQRLRRHHAGAYQPERSTSPFLKEVAVALTPYLPSGDLHLDEREAHLRLPLKINSQTDGVNPVVLLTDGFFGRTPRTDYRWEFDQWQYFSDLHYTILPVWSVNWWKSAQQECRKLTSEIAESTDQPPDRADS